jgi:hypothetical protein
MDKEPLAPPISFRPTITQAERLAAMVSRRRMRDPSDFLRLLIDDEWDRQRRQRRRTRART